MPHHTASPQVWEVCEWKRELISPVSKLWIRVWWWLLLCTYTAPLTQPHSLSISPICIPISMHFTKKVWLVRIASKEEQGLSPLHVYLGSFYTGIRDGGLPCVFQRRDSTNVILHCNEDCVNTKGGIFQLILLWSLFKEKKLCPQFTCLSPVLNGMAQHKKKYNTVLRVFRVILRRKFLLYVLLEISVPLYMWSI